MKLLEVAERIDKSCEDTWFDINKIAEDLGIDNYEYVEQERLKAYWIGRWYCTDTYVGYRMYFLDDEPVAVSSQVGRKCDEKFEWLGKENVIKTKEYLLSLIEEKEDELHLDYTTLDEDIGDYFKIDFSEQIIDHDKAIYSGYPVEILEKIKHTELRIDTDLKVRIDGKEEVISVRDLYFKFNLKED